MKSDLGSVYRSPGTHGHLVLEDAVRDGDEVLSGALVAQDGCRFPIQDGIPDLTWPQSLRERETATIKLYDERADVYDKYLPLTFSTFGECEADVRNAVVDRLGVRTGMRVLEVGAGTGRDSEIIASRLGPSGELFCQDIARSMLVRNRDRLAAAGLQAHFAIANASHLPFEGNVFDAVFQFGGVGEFFDIAGFFREVARVTKPGGRVVVGDESMPPWLRQTSFAKILATTNPQFNAPLPLEDLPIEARDVNLRWIIGGTFYLIDFTVSMGEPAANLDFTIPGPRGGTHRTRYAGQLEGVKPQTKELAQKARAKLGISMHDWLDDIVQREALKVLSQEGTSD
jgi:ubiquinone/menaquinone biosynthesis C-methylase UbiE